MDEIYGKRNGKSKEIILRVADFCGLSATLIFIYQR